MITKKSRVVGFVSVFAVLALIFHEYYFSVLSAFFVSKIASPFSAKHRIALYGFWVNNSSELEHFHPTFLATACQNSDLVDLYFIKIGPGPSTGTFLPFLCSNVFVAKYNSSFFWAPVLKVLEPHFSKAQFDELIESRKTEHPWEMGLIRPFIYSVFESMWPGLWSSHSHWGWIESDTVFGKMSDFLTPHILGDYDVVTSKEWTSDDFGLMFLAGQFAIFKNTPFINRMWQPCVGTLLTKTHAAFFYVQDEGAFSDCVLSQTVTYNAGFTESKMIQSPWLAAYRKECGLPFHGVNTTMANISISKHFTQEETEECARVIRPYLRVYFVRAHGNTHYDSAVLYKQKLFVQSHTCKLHSHSHDGQEVGWGDLTSAHGLEGPRTLISNYTTHIANTLAGGTWIFHEFRHMLSILKGHDSEFWKMLSSDCDWEYTNGKIWSRLPGSSNGNAYKRVTNHTYKSRTLGTLRFDLGFRESIPSWWNDPECLQPVMLVHLSKVKYSTSMRTAANFSDIPIPVDQIEPVVITSMPKHKFGVEGFHKFSPELCSNAGISYCGPFCLGDFSSSYA